VDTMKAMICSKYGPPEVLHIQQCPKPIPRKDEDLRLRVFKSVIRSMAFRVFLWEPMPILSA